MAGPVPRQRAGLRHVGGRPGGGPAAPRHHQADADRDVRAGAPRGHGRRPCGGSGRGRGADLAPPYRPARACRPGRRAARGRGEGAGEVVAKLWGDGTTQTQLDRAGGARAVEWEIGAMAHQITEDDRPGEAPASTSLAARFEALAAEWEKRGEYGDSSITDRARELRAVLAGEAAAGVHAFCTYDEGRADGSGCMLPPGHTGPHDIATGIPAAPAAPEEQRPVPAPCTTPCIACMTDESHTPAAPEETTR
ncbi:hypothetical protein RB201_04465 [Streptomyces sp. S1A(2023)]